MAGNYTQQSTGYLDITYGSVPPSNQFSLVTSNSASLAGTLTVSFANNFAPQAGDRFPIINGAVSGSFYPISVPNLINGELFEAIYTIFYLTLQVQAKTTTTINSSANPSVFGQNVTFAATVNVVSPGAGTPSGTVDFFDTTTGQDLGTVLLIGNTATVSTAGLSVGNQVILATYSGDTNFIVSSSTSFVETIEPVTPTGLQAVISGAEMSNTSPTITLQAANSADAMSILSAINGLASPPAGQSVTILLNATSNLSDVTASPPTGVTLYVTGSNGTTAWVGQSPALIVTSGTVIISNILLKANTAAPTIEVQGGTLELQNCVVQTSTGNIEPAILLTGGTLDLGMGTATDPGDNILNINGLGEFVHNTTGNRWLRSAIPSRSTARSKAPLPELHDSRRVQQACRFLANRLRSLSLPWPTVR